MLHNKEQTLMQSYNVIMQSLLSDVKKKCQFQDYMVVYTYWSINYLHHTIKRRIHLRAVVMLLGVM